VAVHGKLHAARGYIGIEVVSVFLNKGKSSELLLLQPENNWKIIVAF
jgi:hypothetical protein